MTGLEAVNKPQKKKYFYNDDNGDAIIIDEKTLQEAERGENYLSGVSSWWDLGEFENADQARRRYDDLQAEHRYCINNDC